MDNTTEKGYTYLEDLARVSDIPEEGILSRTLYKGNGEKAVLFCFAQGESLSEHTASVPAILYFVKGDATITLGDEAYHAGPGSFVHMPPSLKHSIRAESPLVMLLILLQGRAGGDDVGGE